MNVVPYIDVMLVLLVIFMVTAPILQTGVPVNMAKTDASPLDPGEGQDPLFIAITIEGEISIDNQEDSKETLTTNELTRRITGQLGRDNTRAVYIRADGDVTHKQVIQVMVAAQKAGAKNIGLVTEPNTTTEK
jgi:biopolymer transport protein TolR